MADSPWQKLPKARRAAVYRWVGRAARLAREDGDATVTADLRIAMNVLRSHAKASRAPAKKPAKKRAR